MSMDHIQNVLALAGRREGIVVTSELTRRGIDRHAIRRLGSAGILTPVAAGAFSVAGWPPSWRQMLWVALATAGPDAVASHRAAAVVRSLLDLGEHPPEVTIPRWTGQDHHGFLVHRSTDLTSDQVGRVRGMPVTSVERTLLDLGGVVDGELLETALDTALRRRLTTPQATAAMLERIGRRGRRGTAALRELLAERADVEGITESRFEVRLMRIIRKHRLPEPVRQFRLHDEDGEIGRFDAAYPKAMVVIEADSEAHHTDRRRFIADRTRRDRAEAIGWRVPCFTWHHVTRQQRFVATTIDRTLVAAGWDWRAERRVPDVAS